MDYNQFMHFMFLFDVLLTGKNMFTFNTSRRIFIKFMFLSLSYIIINDWIVRPKNSLWKIFILLISEKYFKYIFLINCNSNLILIRSIPRTQKSIMVSFFKVHIEQVPIMDVLKTSIMKLKASFSLNGWLYLRYILLGNNRKRV